MIENHMVLPHAEPPEALPEVDEDAEYEKHRQRAIDEAREEAALMHQNDEQLDCEAREVIKAERARLEAEEGKTT